MTAPVEPEACLACGATDQELIGITAWTDSPASPVAPVELYCRDIHACYERIRAEEGLPL